MQVMSAGVHDGDVTSCVVFGANFTGVGETGFFFDGKRVKFGPQHYSPAGAVLEDGDNPRTAYVFGDFVSETAKLARQFGCRLRLMGRKFRMLVQIQIQCVRLRIDGLDFLGPRRNLRAK